VSRLPGNTDDLIRSLSRSGVWVGWHPAAGPIGRGVWNSSFGLSRVSPGLAQHFTVGSFSAGIVADVVVGGIWQGVEDYDLWATDPWLATRRVGAAAGTNATVGVVGGGAAAGSLAFLVWAGVISTPPGWVVVGTTIGATVIADLTIGDTIKEKWFKAFDAERSYFKN